MIGLLYISQPNDLNPGDIGNILAISNKKNPELDITGALLFHFDLFLQYLEGPEKAVKDLYTQISSDPRHINCKVIMEEQISERRFPNWSMGNIPFSTLGTSIINTYGLNTFENIEKLSSIEAVALVDSLKPYVQSSLG
ncbi:BLUF domain-containing protein [Magnetococcales bacterium HHB-1]